MNLAVVSSLINLLGFEIGIALHVVRLMLIVRHPVRGSTILYRDFRFAYADASLKRALSFLFLTASVSSVYFIPVISLVAMRDRHLQPNLLQPLLCQTAAING